MTQIRKGDKCWVQWGLKKHYGVCYGHDVYGRPLFVHNTLSAGRVERTGLQGFSGGMPIHVEQQALPGNEYAIAQRAVDLVGQKYDLLRFNCEHAANLAVNGKAESSQVTGWAAVGTLFTIVVGAAGAVLLNENGTTVDANGIRRDASGRFASRRWW